MDNVNHHVHSADQWEGVLKPVVDAWLKVKGT